MLDVEFSPLSLRVGWKINGLPNGLAGTGAEEGNEERKNPLSF